MASSNGDPAELELEALQLQIQDPTIETTVDDGGAAVEGAVVSAANHGSTEYDPEP